MGKIKTKKCSVNLERLDEKLLNLCLQKFGLKLSSSESTSYLKAESLQSNSKALRHSNRFKKRYSKVSSKSSVKHDFERKKGKGKPLCYTDSESSSDGTNFEKKFAQTSSSTKSQSNLVESTDFIPETVSLADEKTICNENFTMETKPALPLPEFEVHKTKIEETSSTFTKDDGWRTENQQVSIALEDEIEIIKEVAKPENIKCDKIEAPSVELPVFGDDEDESREDNEDDTNTVIFEEELDKDTALERVFEFSKEKSGSIASKDYKSREIINEKKQILVKFRRRTLVTKNVASIKSKGAEDYNIKQESPSGVSEEVCCLIKRLQEMYRNIYQLQKEWPNHPELAVHFHKMLNAQKENFYREIKRSRNVLLKSLNTFGDARKLALEVGKRICSNSEDVASVISQCVHFEEPCEVDKSSVEKMICEVVSQSSNNLNKMISENFTRLLKKNVPQQAVNICSSSQPPNRFCCHSEINLMETQTSENYYHMLKRQKLWMNQNRAAIPYTQNLIRVGHVPQYGRPETTISRHHLPLKPLGVQTEDATQYCGVSFVLPCTMPPPPTYSPVFIQKNTDFLPTVHGNVSVILPSGQCAEMYNKIPTQISNNNKSSSFPAKIPNIPQCGFPAKIPNIPQCGFPAIRMTDRRIPNSQNQTTPAVPQDAFINLSTNPLNVANQNIFPGPAKLPKGPCTELNLKTDSENPASRRRIDPTIPQRLTMRNFRLQAGPVLQSQAEETNPSRLITEKNNSNPGGESSRVYVCAQNGCENPGVAICNGCQSIIYCGKSCQLKHWNLKHKAECYQLKKLRG